MIQRPLLGPNVGVLLAIAAAAAATAALSLVTIGHLKDVVVVAVLHHRPVSVSLLLGGLGGLDLFLMLLSVLAVVAVGWLEWRQRGFSRLLATASGTDAFVLLTILVAWFGHAYLEPGVLLGGDTGTHIARFLEVARGLQAGELADWTNYQYAGEPLLWFTGPLTYVAGGALTFAVGDAVLAAKLLLFTLHVLSGWLYFAFLRRLGLSPVGAMVAAAGFAGGFAHLHLFLYRGVFPQAFTIVFLVALFHAADGLLRAVGARWANMAVFGLATAGSILNHQPHAIFAAFYLAVFGAVALFTGAWHGRRLPMLMLAGLLGVVASTVAVVPVLAEADWVMIDPDGALLHWRLPTLDRLAHLVLWHDTRTTWGTDYWAYLGIGLILAGGVGLAALVLRRLPPEQARIGWSAAPCLAICFFLYNPVVRDVIFLLFFLGIFAAIGVDWVIAHRILARRGLLLALLLVVLDLATTSVQPVARTDKGFRIAAGRRLEQIAPNARFLEIHIGSDGVQEADVGPDGGPISYEATVQRVAGNHNMAATHLHNYLFAAAEMAGTELAATGVLTPATQAMLGLFNVGRIICDTPVANGCPASFRGADIDPVLGHDITIPATPVVFSQRLIVSAPPAGLDHPAFWPGDFSHPADRPRVEAIEAALDAFVATERVHPENGLAAAIAVRDSPATRSSSPDQDWHPVLESYAVGLDTVDLRIRSDAPGYAQLAHPWFQSTLVTINGRLVTPLRGTINLLVVPVMAGENEIALRAGGTPVRRAGEIASAAGLVLILAASAGVAWHDRRRGQDGMRSRYWRTKSQPTSSM